MKWILYCLSFSICVWVGCATNQRHLSSRQEADLRAITALHIEQAIWKMVHSTKDWEDADFRIYQEQDIDGDGVDDTILVTTFENADANNTYQKLFVCLSSSPQKVMQFDVGSGKGDRIADEMDIKGQTIIIKGLKYSDDDAMCCPSLPYESTFVVVSGKIVQKQ